MRRNRRWLSLWKVVATTIAGMGGSFVRVCAPSGAQKQMQARAPYSIARCSELQAGHEEALTLRFFDAFISFRRIHIARMPKNTDGISIHAHGASPAPM